MVLSLLLCKLTVKGGVFMEIHITRDADAFICVLYREYLKSRKSGKTIEDSARFGDDARIQETLFPKWQLDDVTHLCWYLAGKNLLRAYRGDNKANRVSLSEDGIVYMENRFPEGISQLLSALGKLASLLLLGCDHTRRAIWIKQGIFFLRRQVASPAIKSAPALAARRILLRVAEVPCLFLVHPVFPRFLSLLSKFISYFCGKLTVKGGAYFGRYPFQPFVV
jgi:hypothetical protein